MADPTEGNDPMRDAVELHLRGNFFPPIDRSYIPWALEILSLVQGPQDAIDWDAMLPVPAEVIDSGMMPRKAIRMPNGYAVALGDIYEAIRLSALVDIDDEHDPTMPGPDEDPDDDIDDETARRTTAAVNHTAKLGGFNDQDLADALQGITDVDGERGPEVYPDWPMDSADPDGVPAWHADLEQRVADGTATESELRHPSLLPPDALMEPLAPEEHPPCSIPHAHREVAPVALDEFIVCDDDLGVDMEPLMRLIAAIHARCEPCQSHYGRVVFGNGGYDVAWYIHQELGQPPFTYEPDRYPFRKQSDTMRALWHASRLTRLIEFRVEPKHPLYPLGVVVRGMVGHRMHMFELVQMVRMIETKRDNQGQVRLPLTDN